MFTYKQARKHRINHSSNDPSAQHPAPIRPAMVERNQYAGSPGGASVASSVGPPKALGESKQFIASMRTAHLLIERVQKFWQMFRQSYRPS
jgi:hypothetical protein